MKAHNRVFGLDLMRALAILFVVVAHSQRQIQVVFLTFGPTQKWMGHPLFCFERLLIGRIIFRTIEGRNFRSLVRFYNRRWWRTLPNYYFFFALHIVFYYVFSIQENIDWRGLLFLQNINSPPEGFFRESWSLAVEEWFYLVFPFIWWLLYQKEVKPRIANLCDLPLGMLLLAWAYKAWFFLAACQGVLPVPIAGIIWRSMFACPWSFDSAHPLGGVAQHRFHVQKKMVR